ncbi:hypothetical protein Sango_0207500 [Sesamum angolense]|uniref:SET domain-containing protein n=1 Tax=Sesamum angolense TaxID=2727404 RepID=A0AAE1XG49_9LAMI|nr:hypothetical protein Sango_0207500 [Sesamum angolense]
MATGSEEAKLELFLQWLKVNGAELRGCKLKYCNSNKGFGIFATNDVPDGILLVVPLDLAITPMRVLQDPLIGPDCRSLFEEGEVDDRLLIMLFLTVERLRKSSSWKPYLDMLPTEFGNPLWFTDDEFSELKGTTLHRATELQRKNLKSLFDGKVKKLVEKLLALDGSSDRLKSCSNLEVDGTGSTTGIPFSMYLLSAGNVLLQAEKEISISYGNKGNEELLYLYGFVIKDNPDDYLMKGELRCLLPRSLLKSGFFPESTLPGRTSNEDSGSQAFNYSWSGQRKAPSYINKLVFPEEFLTALRTITMKENELYKVSSLLEELVGSGGERQPSETEVRTAVWEACGDSGAFQLLVDLLNMKLMELEEGSGTEESDAELLKKADNRGTPENERYRAEGADSSFHKGGGASIAISIERGELEVFPWLGHGSCSLSVFNLLDKDGFAVA